MLSIFQANKKTLTCEELMNLSDDRISEILKRLNENELKTIYDESIKIVNESKFHINDNFIKTLADKFNRGFLSIRSTLEFLLDNENSNLESDDIDPETECNLSRECLNHVIEKANELKPEYI
ncbi:MAG: hypothetical protein H0W64_05045 [Gammaproteobacteria bacterium]|nr:hypothetical protein [Gammaproteobacteria bacterium]